MNKMDKIELLAPAGNAECLVAAVQSGADAVYLSGKNFGARSFADNFDNAGLEKAADYCHLRNVRIHVTVNTLVSDAELGEIKDYIVFLNKIGVDAVIVQDLGIADVIKSISPELPVHASTQMTVHSSGGVRFAESLGMSRVVLSRELSLSEIKKISEETSAELEVFGHGALCMCYSGQCLMSSIIGGRSGNRGKCAQPCRLPYKVNGGNKKAFFMSLKDLCSLSHIRELEDAGVASLKIEGRMKGAAYVAAVVQVYRKYTENPQKVQSEDLELLDSIFNRGGLTDGYLTGNTGRKMFAFDKPDNPYLKGKTETVKMLDAVRREENRKKELLCRVAVSEGAFPKITLSDGECSIEYIYEKAAETALKAPLTKEYVTAQLGKTGGTPYSFKSINVDLCGNPFMAAGDINALRRGGLESFEKQFLGSFRRKGGNALQSAGTESPDSFSEPHNTEEKSGYTCEVTRIHQFEALKNMPFELFYVPLDIILQHTDTFAEYKGKTVIALPSVIRDGKAEMICRQASELLENGFRGVAVQNPGLIKKFGKYKVYGGFRLNVFNSRALAVYAGTGIAAAELSPELRLKQIREIRKCIPVQAMVYGRLPLMVTENCVLRNGGACPCGENGFIEDRMDMRFPVIKDGSECRSVILNCKKTYTADFMPEIKAAGVSLYRMYFTDETAEECVRVCKAYFEGTGYRPDDRTGAYYYKGVM